MTEEMNASVIENVERRQRRGTWPWFVFNVILFPAPAHLTLLRVKEFNFGKTIRHLGITVLLFLVLLTAALLQLVLPGIGRLWMLFPLLSGIVVLYANRSLKGSFKPFDLSLITDTHKAFLVGTILIFTAISIVPALDLIEFEQKSIEAFKGWIAEIDFWQEILILLLSLFLLFVGFVLNATAAVTINRVFILYACFVVFTGQIFVILFMASEWLKIQGGFWMRLAATFLAAMLALDYWDAKTIGQYVRRYFFLTCTKGLSFVFLWLCFFGLPQKSASVFSEFYYNQVRPAPIQCSPHYLIFNEHDRFVSAHEATRRMRALYAKAFIDSEADTLHRLARMINRKNPVIPADSDICRLTDLIERREQRFASVDFDKVPLFRPIQKSWDVMLTALLFQGTISDTDLDKYIAGFKAMLPKTSQGRLPRIDTSYEAHYVSMATETSVDFIPPRFEYLEDLLKKNLCPVISLRLSGVDYWVALLSIDQESGMVWFRIETVPRVHEAIQLLFDADEYRVLKNEILSRIVVPLPLDYFRSSLEHHSAPVVIFTKNGLDEAMPDRFDHIKLAEINHSFAARSTFERPTESIFADDIGDPFFEYARYFRTIFRIKFLLWPKRYGRNFFPSPVSDPVDPKGVGRLNEIDALIDRILPLYDTDRMNIAYLMAEHNHVYGAPDLFIKLAAKKPDLSDLIECTEAFTIGRQLFLLGRHEEAFGYLELAFQRHPFNSKYEQWYRITRVKLNQPPVPLYSPSSKQPYLTLYYQTVTDIQKGNEKAAKKRLEKILEKDTHDSLANHLLNRYFNQPLDDRHFFPTQEGL